MFRIIPLICLMAILSACSKNISVIQLKENNTILKEHGLIYYLPQVIIEIETEVTTEVFVPGPFNSYAEKFLSIKNVSAQKMSVSDITNICFREYYTIDSDACFMMFNTDKHNLRFSPDMRLLSLNTGSIDVDKTNFYEIINIPQYDYVQNLFTDMTSEENFTSILDTTYKVIEIDSVFQKIPVYNAVMTSKTEEQKAEEAAEFILELRKSRMVIMQGDMDNLPSSGATKQMLEKIDEMEQKYLELFIGKTYYLKNTFNYIYRPIKTKVNDTQIMFYICDKFGISTSAGLDRIPVELIYNNHGLSKEYERFMTIQTEIKEKKKGIYYRIPSSANIVINADSHVYANKSLIVPQSGTIASLPKKIMERKHLRIKFHPQYGSILFIK